MIVAIPHVIGLEEECHNFLYEAKNFIRDTLRAFNLLYGTGFVEASEFYRAKKPKKENQSLISFAESKFGPNDAKTELFKQMFSTFERVVNYRNAVEHPEGFVGSLKIRNFRLDPNGKFTEPGWWLEKDGNKRSESSIRADLCGIIENLLILAEEMIVHWACDNLLFPKSMRIALVPGERRDPNNPIQYVVTASVEFEQKLAKFIEAQQGGAYIIMFKQGEEWTSFRSKKAILHAPNSSSSPMCLRRMNGWRTSQISKPGELIKKMCGSLSGLRVCMITWGCDP